MGIDAAMGRQSYAPGQVGVLRVSTDEPAISTQVLKAGPDPFLTYADNLLEGDAVTSPSIVDWSRFRNAPRTLPVEIGADWESGLYFVRLAAADGTVGYAPFVVRPAALGARSRVAVILPTNTWQAYNFCDADGDGWGDTWYAGFPNKTHPPQPSLPPPRRPPVLLPLRPGHSCTGCTGPARRSTSSPRATSETSPATTSPHDYDLVVFPGHSEYVTTHEYDTVERYRDLGGNLIFLSANNFFWRVVERDDDCTGRPSGATSAGRRRRCSACSTSRTTTASARAVRRSATRRRAAGSGRAPGSPRARRSGEVVGGFGIEIDATTAPTRRRGRSCSRRSPTCSAPV